MKCRVLVKVCRRCGVEYHPSHTLQTYCRPSCRWEAEREANAVRLETVCPQCGKAFRRSTYQKYCSISCGTTAYHAGNRKLRNRSCPECGESFVPYPSALRRNGGRYCSRACYRKSVGARPAMLDVSCTVCGKAFRRTQAAVRRVKASFCGAQCRTDYYVGENSAMFRGGTKQRRGPGWAVARRFVRERDKVCRLCGKTPEENGQALSVDHIIPWRLFTDERKANEVKNLAALCRSCHAKKTAQAERRYMVGDVLDHLRYVEQLKDTEWTAPEGEEVVGWL